MALIVLDTSVVLGGLDPADAHHPAAAAALRRHERDELVLPASAYAEVLVHPIRAGAHAVERVELALTTMAIRVEPLSREIAGRAARIRAAHRIGLPDALVLATGDHLGADVILTADASWGRVSRRVEVV